MTNWSWRVAYWVGFRLARLWWRLRRPDQHGALVAIWFNGRILTVRQSYRANTCLPGGGIGRGEHPREAARRELAEELALAVNAADLVLALETVVDWDFCRDHVRIFELHLQTEPRLRIDNREIVQAGFVDPQALLADVSISPAVRAYLQRAATSQQHQNSQTW